MNNDILFPVITKVEQNDDTLTLSLTIPENLYYFTGHFPEAPILAGVVQVHWALYYLDKHFSMQISDYKSVDALKFQVVIAPNYQIKLCLKKLKDNKYSFNYSSDHGNHSSGKVVYQ